MTDQVRRAAAKKQNAASSQGVGRKPGPVNAITTTSESGSIELTEGELRRVSGGVQKVREA